MDVENKFNGMNIHLSPEEILSIVKSGEGYNSEFKVSLPSKFKEITAEICAFANAAGGVLFVGVDDENKIRGVSIDNTKRSALQNSLNEINPYIPTSFYSVEVEGKSIWVIEVNSGLQKPYVLSGAIYVRQGPNTQKLTTVEQMRDFFQQSDRIYFDESPCSGFSLDKDLDLDWFLEFRNGAGISQAISPDQIIHNLKLLLPDGSMKNGGALFFGEKPEQFLETAVIRCVSFEGENKTNIVDDKTYGGPLIRQYEQAMLWLKGKLDVRYEIIGGGPRIEHWEIPQTAFKEAIINALSHRDYYDKGAKINIELFDNRVEISNPGGLTSAISKSEFGTKSHSRNPLIFGLFVRMHMVEQVGSGIGRMKDEMKAVKLPAPEFKMDGLFTVVFHRNITEKSSGKSSGKSSVKDWADIKRIILEIPGVAIRKSGWAILEMTYNNQHITIPEMAKKIKITERAVEKNIQNLKATGILDRAGSDKYGHWKINIQR